MECGGSPPLLSSPLLKRAHTIFKEAHRQNRTVILSAAKDLSWGFSLSSRAT